MPKFSIILPTYNRSICITKTIDSVLNQTYTDFELIIVDDGSIDNTEKLIKDTYSCEISHNKIIYYKNSTNHGVSNARNIGLKLAKYSWITYIDSDDIYDTKFLEIVKNNIVSNPEYKNFYCKAKHIYINTQKIVGYKFNYNDYYNNKLFIGTPQYVHHISLINEIQNFDEKIIRGVDWDMILAHAKKYTPCFIDEVLVYAHYDNIFKHLSQTQDFGYCKQYIKNKHKPM